VSDRPGFDLQPEAAQDISDIWEYIGEDDTQAAGRFREAILDAIRLLVASPSIGHRRPDLTSLPIRFWRVPDYLIAYVLNERTHR
jgi:plasmid stabilization system protein ParE